WAGGWGGTGVRRRATRRATRRSNRGGGESGPTMVRRDDATTPGALVRADQPWGDAALARLYDAFPFEADLPLYLELAAAEGGRVLELACGTGRVLVPLAEAGNRVVGLDASPHMLALAREKLAAAGSAVATRARLVQGDMRCFRLGGEDGAPF